MGRGVRRAVTPARAVGAPASPARFIELLLCRCIAAPKWPAARRCGVVGAQKNYAYLCTQLAEFLQGIYCEGVMADLRPPVRLIETVDRSRKSRDA